MKLQPMHSSQFKATDKRRNFHRWLILVALLPFFCFAEDWDKRLSRMGMVDVATLDSSIRVHLVYGTSNNFMNKAVYENLQKAWLHPDAAEKLVRAQQRLKQEHPAYSLLVYDAARPIAIQRIMWDLVKGTSQSIYVSNPNKRGGRHNYGMAVDVTILGSDNKPLYMGTPFDFFGKAAHTNNETELVKQKLISEKELQNRLLLRCVMRFAGFTTINSEWWHFNACSAEEAKMHYQLIE